MLAVLLVTGWATGPPTEGPAGAEPECPAGVECRFVPAAYGPTVPGNPSDYGNYDHADRPGDGNNIRYIVIHDTEESYAAAMRGFRRTRSGVSAHYLIDSPSGRITQLVPTRDIAFHAGNYWFNSHSIGIEHVGMLAQGEAWYTEAVYQASARLVRYLAARYHVPLDRQHILGHEDIPGATPRAGAAMHYDPGPYWNWDHYFALLGAPLPDAATTRRFAAELGRREQAVAERLPGYRTWPAGRRAPPTVLVNPGDAQPSAAVLTSCLGQPCGQSGRQQAGRRLPGPPVAGRRGNAVELHRAPSPGSPLLGDPLLHPDGGPGTTRLSDWSATATTGQSFVVAGRAPGWTAVWFGGRRGWLPSTDTLAVAPGGTLLTPRPGCAAIPVYGAAEPERGAYPPAIEPVASTPLPYVVPAGQVYLGAELVRTTSYYAKFDAPGGPPVPANHTVVTGRRLMWEISFNHRRAFLDAADVQPFGAQPATTPHRCAVPEPPVSKPAGPRTTVPKPGPQPPPLVVVRAGDNLDALASALHVPGGWPALYRANRARIADPALIHPGLRLTLPGPRR